MDRPTPSTEPVESNPEPEAYRASFDVQRVRPSTAIVLAIASIEDVDPPELGVLYDMLDPDALVTLIQSTPHGTAGDIQVSVRFDAYRVTLYSYGILEIRPFDDEDDTATESRS